MLIAATCFPVSLLGEAQWKNELFNLLQRCGPVVYG